MPRAGYIHAFPRSSSSGTVIAIFTTGLLGLFLIICIATIAICCLRRYRRALARTAALEKKAQRDFAARTRRVQSAYVKSSELAYPLCALRYGDFKGKGRLWKHEEARAEGKLVVYDTTEEMARAIERGGRRAGDVGGGGNRGVV
jgi:hypothetical protein